MAQRRLVRSSRVRRVAGPVLVVLALLAIVAVAATGSTSSGSGTSTPPGDTLLDTIFSLLLLLSVAWVAIAVFSLVRWREHEWTAPRGRNDIRAIAMLLAFGFALAPVRPRARLAPGVSTPQQTTLDRGEGGAAPPGFDAGPDPGYQFQFAWLPVVAVLGLAAVGVVAFVLSTRRARPASPKAQLAAELALTLDLSSRRPARGKRILAEP